MEYLVPFLCALGASLVVTPLAMWLARRLGAVAKPRTDRWHRKPTPMLGGIAIFVGFLTPMLAFGPMTLEMIGLLVGGGIVFVLGLVDDLRPIRPAVKLLGQLVAACVLIPCGIHAIFVLHPLVAIPATLLWIVAVTNAFNLLDNMDGLSAGIGLLSSLFTFLVSWHLGQEAVAIAAISLAGASLGFLVFNFNPARIFMGDCGSLFLGFNLGALSILGTWREASSLSLILLMPMLVLAVPLFDTTLVTIVRKFSGRAVSQGGRDHSSHRLVALGLTERTAVLVLYAVAAAFGGLAVVGLWLDLFVSAIAAGVLLVLILFFGVFLAEAKVYPQGRQRWEVLKERSPILSRVLFNKWLIIELSTDLVLISAAYMLAYFIRFEGSLPPQLMKQIHELLPIVLPVHIASLVFFRVYQEEWRYGGLHAYLRVVKAVVVAGALSFFAVKLLTNFTFYSRGVFVIAALASTLMVMGSRSTLTFFRTWFRRRRRPVGRAVLVVGAGDAAERVIREMQRHPELGLDPVAALDDDPSKRGRRLHGVPVTADCADIPGVVGKVGAEEIIYAIPSLSGPARHRLLRGCIEAGVPYQVVLGAREIVRTQRSAVQAVEPTRLLARTRIVVEESTLRDQLRDQTLLVMGAATPAALELVRWAGSFGAKRVVLAGPEGAEVSRQLEALGLGAGVEGRIAHLADEGSVGRVLREVRPDVAVFAACVRSRHVADLDPAGTLETNLLAVAAFARQVTACGVRQLVLWTGSGEESGSAAAPSPAAGDPSLELAELAAAAFGPARVVALRLPSIAEEPGSALETAQRGSIPRFAAGERTRAVLTSEVAAATLTSLDVGAGAWLLSVVAPEVPLGLLADLALRDAALEAGAHAASALEAAAPLLRRSSLPRLSKTALAQAEVKVREALVAGRLEEAWAAASELRQGGTLIALD